jgi:hypothetical protein
MNGPRPCGACGALVIQAFTGARPRAVLLDYAKAPKGAVAARIDGRTGVWVGRYLVFGESVDPDREGRFRQHDVTCTRRPRPLVET